MVVVCLEHSADLYMAQLMPLPLTISCFSKIQVGFTFLVPAHLKLLTDLEIWGWSCTKMRMAVGLHPDPLGKL